VGKGTNDARKKQHESAFRPKIARVPLSQQGYKSTNHPPTAPQWQTCAIKTGSSGVQGTVSSKSFALSHL